MKIDKNRETRKKSISVGFLYEATRDRFKLQAMNGENGFENQIKDKNLNRPSLALAGYVDLFTFDRVQLIGNTEMRYLDSLTGPKRTHAMMRIFEFKIPCIILTNGNKLPEGASSGGGGETYSGAGHPVRNDKDRVFSG